MATSYSLPDLTGKNPNYLQVNLPYHIYANNIKLAFENSPVFANSIRIVLTDGSGMVFVKDQHYKIEASDIDQTAMSKAFLQDENFADILVKSVTIISSAVVGKRVAVNVQQFYDTIPGRDFDDGAPIQFTPSLLKSLVSGLADVRQQQARVTSVVTPVEHTPTLLPFDINGELESNKVEGEKFVVNTVHGGSVIGLVQGPFFADSLVLTKDGVPLTEEDYLPIMPSPLTARTTNASGIYRYILLTKPLTGEVEVGYHALGGEVQQKDIELLYDLAVSIKDFLNNQIFLTPESIPDTAAFRALHARLTIQENNVRSILSGAPTYGDATSNQVTRRPVQASDSKLHWYTIADLFKVTGSTDVVTTDQFKGRVFFPGAKVSLSFTVDVNLEQTRNPVTFSTNNLVFDPLYTLFSDVSVAAPVYPLLRVVWNKISEGLSGASLQIGIPLTALSDTMIVEDLSTQESCWILNKSGEQITGNTPVSPSGPRDDGFLLPDGSAIWSKSSSSSLSRVHVPKFDQGYLTYSGSTVTLNNIAGGPEAELPVTPTNSTKNLFNVVLPSYFPLASLSQVVVTMANGDGSAVYDVVMNVASLSNGSKFGKNTFTDFGGRRCTMSATLIQDVGGAITVSLNTSTSPLSSDVIRYIRAKV